ncbi:MAG: ATP-binding protein [Rivularia sp. (in: Bacteria)]|nr:ATP-binding protein [Rivularia sp. MS3]
MNNQAIAKVQFLQRQAASLLLYQSVFEGEVGKAFLNLLQAIRYPNAEARDCLQAYGNFFQILADKNQNWEEYLISQILISENAFSKQSQLEKLPPALIAAAKHDLQALQSFHECSVASLGEWVQTVAHLPILPVVWYTEQKIQPNYQSKLIEKLRTLEDWTNAVEDLTAFYRQHGTGIFAEYKAFRWQQQEFIGITYPDEVKLDELVAYESPKQTLIQNTEFLLSGQLALHVLLYGSRGSGKSSLVKALLNEYAERNLRLIEVAKSELKHLPQIVERLRNKPQKFIIFVDDLSFEEDDDAFKALKVVLEGSLTARPKNVVVYATSNRRHLIREFFADRPQPKEADEVNAWDTVQEKLSFSDRFGLTLTFEPASQKAYLQIVQHLVKLSNIEFSTDELNSQALQWATRHNGRSGRTARQFVDFLKAQKMISRNEVEKDK